MQVIHLNGLIQNIILIKIAWNSLITPQPNKYAEILLPTPELNPNKRTKFIIEDEVWYLIENDFSSAPGIMYMSLCEEKINAIYDDLENDIADTDKLAKYSIVIPEEEQSFLKGSTVTPIFSIYKDGVKMDTPLDVEYTCLNRNIVYKYKGVLKAGKIGTAGIKITLKDYPDISTTINVNVISSESEKVFSGYIEGDSTIKLDRSSKYSINSNIGLTNITYTISDSTLASIETKNDYCIITANSKNKLGTIILEANCDGNTISKEIKIIPLW